MLTSHSPDFVGAYYGANAAKSCHKFSIVTTQSGFDKSSYEFLVNSTEATDDQYYNLRTISQVIYFKREGVIFIEF